MLQNLKRILIYTDSDLTELALVLVLVIIDPLRVHDLCCFNVYWSAVSAMCGLTLLAGLMRDSLAIRQTGLLAATAFLAAATAIELSHGHWDLGTHGTLLVQATVAGFLWYRDSLESASRRARKKVSNGTK